MKLSFLIIISAVLFSNKILSQDYQTVRPERIVHFENNHPNKTIASIRIDEIKHKKNGITELYNYNMIRRLENNELNLNGGSWIGKKIIINQHGLNTFINKNNDSIRIFTRAPKNIKWIFYIWPNGDYIEGEVIKIETLNFLGISDLVKFIRLNKYNSNDSLIVPNYLNQYFMLSRDYGLLNPINFYEFPDFNYDYMPDYKLFDKFQLIGMTNPEVGWQNITAFDIFSYQIGDEFHVKRLNDEIYSYYYSKNEYIYKVLDFEITPNEDTLIYQYQYCQRITNTNSENVTEINSYEGIKSESTTLSYYDYLNVLPLEPTRISSRYTFYFKDEGKITGATMMFSGGDNDTILYFVYDIFDRWKYYKNLGVYWNISNDDSRFIKELVYYNTTNGQWGTPYICDSLLVNNDIIESEDEIDIFPNPFTDILIIENNQDPVRELMLEIYDFQGKMILRELIITKKYSVNLSGLPSSLYIVKLSDINGATLAYKKIIKK